MGATGLCRSQQPAFLQRAGEGFENRIVTLLAHDLDAAVSYTWWAQRRGFIRSTLQAGLCDLVPGVPYALDMLRTTAPYYRSTYVFVTRKDGPDITSFDDARLRQLRVGVELIGDDGANSPPVHALGQRGIVGNLRGYPVYGDYTLANPPARIVEAVAAGQVDVAVVWGPLAGYFAKLQPIASADRTGDAACRPADAAHDLRDLDGRASRRRRPYATRSMLRSRSIAWRSSHPRRIWRATG